MPQITIYQCDRCGKREDSKNTQTKPGVKRFDNNAGPVTIPVRLFAGFCQVTEEGDDLEGEEIVFCESCQMSFTSWWLMSKYLPDQRIEIKEEPTQSTSLMPPEKQKSFTAPSPTVMMGYEEDEETKEK